MEPKTALNNTQRKMLDTIFTERINKKVRLHDARRRDEREKLVKAELEKANKDKDVKEYQKLHKQLKDLEKTLANKGIKLNTKYDGSIEVSLGSSSYGNNAPLAVEAFDEETRRIEEKIVEATTEVRARIYGMDTSYEEVDQELLDYFSFLDK